jgi:hypothetical protein
VVGGSAESVEEAERVVEVRSAMRPKMKVIVERERPIIVRNWRCQPKDEF